MPPIGVISIRAGMARRAEAALAQCLVNIVDADLLLVLSELAKVVDKVGEIAVFAAHSCKPSCGGKLACRGCCHDRGSAPSVYRSLSNQGRTAKDEEYGGRAVPVPASCGIL